MFTEVIGAIDHARKHPANRLIAVVQVFEIRLRQIPRIESIIQPGLGFVRFTQSFINFVDEGCFITSPRPRFREHRFHRAGAPSNLIDQSVALFTWKVPAHNEKSLRGITGRPIDLQFTKRLRTCHTIH